MDALVGARLEVVAPPKITDPGDRVRLLVLLFVTIAIHAWLIGHTVVTARDGIGFARIALQIEQPGLGHAAGEARRTLADVFREAQHPPLYPITVWLTSIPVRYFAELDLPSEMLLATQIASSIAGILLIIPVYWLGRTLFSKFAGFAAAAMIACLPVFARISSDGLTEGLYLFLLASALLLGVRAIRSPGIGAFLLCGLVTGLTYLTRPEGMMVGMATALVGCGLGAFGRWSRTHTMGYLTALVVGISLAAAPYMLLIGGLTNKPTGSGMTRLENWRTRLLGEVHTPSTSGPLFAAWFVPGEDGSKAVWAVKAVLSEGMKSFHYVPAFLCIGGIWLIRRRLRAEPWLIVPVLCMAINFCVIMALVSLKVDSAGRSYVSERHMLPIALIGIIFAAGALEPLGRWLATRTGVSASLSAGFLLVAICISALPSVLKPLHDNRAGHVYAGRWLREHASAADTIIDPFEWAQFFAGRTLYDIPPDPMASSVSFAILEGATNDTPNSHLPRHAAALAVAQDGRSQLVYHWPEQNRLEDAKIRIYRLEQTDVK
ncbi:MAG: glycosyltransferase family 39 protein [Bacteroidales bacterium]|nr:glycosyltransferase family 39 protein [Bacteroidales bacterium]